MDVLEPLACRAAIGVGWVVLVAGAIHLLNLYQARRRSRG